MDLRFKTPFSMIVASPSNSGKSTWVGKLVANSEKLFLTPPTQTFYFFKVWSPTFSTWRAKNIEFIRGMCTQEWIQENCSGKKGTTIILDDQAMEISEDIAKVFSVLSHNYNINFIMLAQNLFTKNRFFRDASLNSSYIVLGKNPRDQSSIRYLSRQMLPNRSKEIIDSYHLATMQPYSFLLLDFTQTCPESLRIRSNIFAENNTPIKVYIKK